ncbi:PREDICTED: homeobox protein orthopedia-like [Gekko japonicus]|uniref:Homeobox protein orthopedia-like n=1 Tax=Gekko japonicus TaxID=146911 RepID=A0ABM1JJJ2_GEKJA|nr:PREDICTED: homeobox protein orthopedia-like [Gekko japonicus]
MKDAAELLGHREAVKCRLGVGGSESDGHPGDLAPNSDLVEGATLLPGKDLDKQPGKDPDKQQGQPGSQNPSQGAQQQGQQKQTRFTPAQLNEQERSFAKTHYPDIFMCESRVRPLTRRTPLPHKPWKTVQRADRKRHQKRK